MINQSILESFIEGLGADGSLSAEDYQKIINFILTNGSPELNPRDLIQIRRGLKNTLPILALAEFGFTTDTHELFIGNGSSNVNITNSLGVDPDSFIGTDTEKVQSAVNYAISNKKFIVLNRMFSITGSILIDKELNSRDIVSFLGTGGGFLKINSGFLFSSTLQDTGDIYFNNVKFESLENSGTKLFDANKLIRCSILNCYLRNVDMFIEANSRYIQSFRIDHCNIVGGKGYLIEMDKSYDFTFSNNLVEHRESFIRNINPINDPDNNNLRILNNVIEGLSGFTFKLGSCFGGEISGNYFESNLGNYIDLTQNVLSYHNGLSLNCNTFQQTPQQITDDVEAIKIHRIGSYGVNSFGNTSTGILYEIIGSGTGGRVISIGDVSYTNEIDKGITNDLRLLGRNTVDGNVYKTGSVLTKFIDSIPETFAASEVKIISVPTGLTLKHNDIITAELSGATGSIDVSLLHIFRNGNTVNVRVKNDSLGSQDITIKIKVMQIEF